MLNAHLTFIHNEAWVDLGGKQTYRSHTLKSTKMNNLVYRVFHWIISYTLNAHQKSNRQVTIWDLQLMFTTMNDICVDSTRCLISWMYYNKNEKFAIHFSMLISFFIVKTRFRFGKKRILSAESSSKNINTS